MTLEPVQVLSEKHWRVFLEQSTDALALLDREGVILYESSNVQNILGYRAEELVGRRAFEFVHPADKRAAEEAFNQNLTHPRQRYTTQTRFLRKDGSVCWVEANIANWLDDPELGAVLVSYHDISERKKAQEALAANLKLQEQLEKTASTVSGMLHTFKIDADGKASMPYASPTIADVYGLKAEDVAEDASPIFDLIDPRDKLEVDAQIRASARDMTPWRAKFRIHHPTKGLRWIDGHSTPVREADGSLLWHGFIQDITERRQAEEALRLSNERFTELANNIPEMFWVLDPVTQKSLYVSPAFEDIMGQSIERLEQLPNGFLGALLPEDLPILLHARSQERIGLKTDIQYRIIRPDGSIRWLHDKASPIYDENGIVVRVVGIASDLTEQVAAENRLLESEARFRQMAENIQEVFWMFDNQQQKLVYLSPAYEKIWGRSIESSYRDTRQYIEAIHPEDRGIMFAALARQARGESTEMEYRIMRPDGSVSWIHDRSFPIFGAKGEIVRTTGIATDITERKLAEAAARQSEEKYQHELLELNRSLEERVQERTAEVQDLYENAPTGYHSLDANGKCPSWRGSRWR